MINTSIPLTAVGVLRFKAADPSLCAVARNLLEQAARYQEVPSIMVAELRRRALVAYRLGLQVQHGRLAQIADELERKLDS